MKEKKRIWDEVEKEAWKILKGFQEHPIRTVLLALVIIWFIKKLIYWIKD